MPTDDSGAGERERWRQEFPYHWDADDMVSRREFVRFAVLTSGALFLGTVAFGILGTFDKRKRGTRKAIVKANEVPVGQAYYFHYPGSDDQAMLLNLPGRGFVAYSQKCTHLSCAVYYQANKDRLFCPCHDGQFDLATGEPTAGPPQRRLPHILLEQDGDMLYATRMVP